MRIRLLVRDYLTNTSVHGLRIIVQKDRHWAERVLWTVLTALSWIGAGVLINSSWEAFQNSAVSYVVETNYLQANVSFPSISVCEDGNLPRVYEESERMYGEYRHLELDEILGELTYFRGSAYYMNEFCTDGSLLCPKGNYSQIALRARSSCEEFFEYCAWNETPFNCCKHFVPTDTELGPCFTFGNRLERKLLQEGDPAFIDTVANRRSNLPTLRVELRGTSRIYMHSETDLPFWNTPSSYIMDTGINLIKTYRITATDVDNPAELRSLSISQRQCRFPDENNLATADLYSFGSCIVDCRWKAQLRLCNCTSHFMPKSNPEQHCNQEGLLCMHTNYGHLAVLSTRWSMSDGLKCNCLPGCHEADYNIESVTLSMSLKNTSVTDITLARLPTSLYRIRVVQNRLTLLVSVGSAAALFFGASALSVAEFFFFLFRIATDGQLKPEISAGANTGQNFAMLDKPPAVPCFAITSNINPLTGNITPPADPGILPGPTEISFENEVNKATSINLPSVEA